VSPHFVRCPGDRVLELLDRLVVTRVAIDILFDALLELGSNAKVLGDCCSTINNAFTRLVSFVHWIVVRVRVKIDLASVESQWILTCPSADGHDQWLPKTGIANVATAQAGFVKIAANRPIITPALRVRVHLLHT
jgi:hypothetical protein